MDADVLRCMPQAGFSQWAVLERQVLDTGGNAGAFKKHGTDADRRHRAEQYSNAALL